MGIEALSRGSHVSFVEKEPLFTASLHKNLESLASENEKLPVVIFPIDVFHFFEKNKKTYKKEENLKGFDYIFLDPPYPKKEQHERQKQQEKFSEYDPEEYYEKLLKRIFTSNFIKKTSMLILEHPYKIDSKDFSVHCIHARRYGQSTLSFFQA